MKRAGRAVAVVLGGALAVLAARPAAAAAPWRVGSKAFTESVVLGEIAVQLARDAGREATHHAGLGGTRLLWDALAKGELDAYPEYTGTLAEEVLRDARPAGSRGQGWVAGALAARGVGVVGPLGFNNTYALGVKRAVAERLGLRTITDLRAHPELRFGFSSEFMSRADGWPLLRARYELAPADVKGLDHDLAYRGLASGAIDVTDLYATDPEIRRDDLVVLQDDRGIFPRYDAVLLYRLDSARDAPEVLAAWQRLRGRIDAGAMAAMNARVKLERVSEQAVAAAFLKTTFGLAAPQARAPGRLEVIARYSGRHLFLVGLSLLAAIVLAVPLGIFAARRRRLGQVVLAAVGIVQTIPSLALLVFMIPLLGIGPLPALVALFLYSLLPIVRNTHAGLRGISPALLESAEALGLPRGAILWRIELPLASPLILAGIKSAAVINVGTATLGALVGAGGLGEPIFTGIRLDDVALIMEGAIPASVLALLVQGLFELIERGVVSSRRGP